jgi:hypothetical protein
VLDFAKKQELAYLSVGDHPQRIRHGFVSEKALAAPPATAAATSTAASMAANPLGQIGDEPDPAATGVQSVDLEMGKASLPGTPVMAVAGLLLLSSLAARSMQRSEDHSTPSPSR